MPLPDRTTRYKFVWTCLRSSAGARAAVGFLAFALLWLGLASPAYSQIYSWRDAGGKLVLSRTKPRAGADVKSFAVLEAERVRATRYVTAAQSRLYDQLIRDHAALNGVRPDLVKAVVQVESGYDPYAKSPKGAMGLMQLMPATCRKYGVKNAFNPVENVGAGVAYLRDLLDRYQNDETLALAAYNAGPGAVDDHGQTVPPYRETRNYVAQINKLAPHAAEPRGKVIYKVTDVVDGRAIIKYTDRRPATGAYEIVGAR
jgi:soluble lytic murein transglycosylase-like protein